MANPIIITSPARLHFGFISLGGKNRAFSSVGMGISGPGLRLTAHRSATINIQGADARPAEKLIRRFCTAHNIQGGVTVHIERIIPHHIGLGSGTQLALSIGHAIATLYAIKTTTKAIAQTLNRGQRSGIGIGAFDRGGVLIDAQAEGSNRPADIISHHPWPQDWRIILLFDPDHQGIHGIRERGIFADINPYDAHTQDHLYQLLIFDLLPALTRQDFIPFARAIGQLQTIMGDHFSQHQGASYTSPVVAKVLAALAKQGCHGYGQSSWGPTGFILCANTGEVKAMRCAIAKITDRLRIEVHNGRRFGHRTL